MSIPLTRELGQTKLENVPALSIDAVHPRLSVCKNCGITGEGVGLYIKQYLLLKCPKCRIEWALCLICKRKQKSRIESKKKLTTHESNNHKKTKAKNQLQVLATPVPLELPLSEAEPFAEEEVFMNTDADSSTKDADNAPSLRIPLQEVTNPANLGFTNKTSQNYFRQCHSIGTPDSGIEYLVKRSLLTKEFHQEDYKNITLAPNHAILQMRIAQLCFLLTRGQCELLGTILGGCYNIGCEDGYFCSQQSIARDFVKWSEENKKSPEFVMAIINTSLERTFSQHMVLQPAHQYSIRIPQSFNDIRTYHLEANRSIIQNIPIPTIHTDVAGHSYVSIMDCIRHLLGHEHLKSIALIPPSLSDDDVKENVDHCSKSLRAREILEQTHQLQCKHLTSYVMIWTDDVEPNRHKSNRGSVWLMTATIATPLGYGHRMENTYPIAVGKKNAGHEPVVRKVEEDMEKLRTGSAIPFYIGQERKKVDIAFELFAALQDQPERRDFNYLRAGNGTHSARFGVSANHRALYPVLVSCEECLKIMESRMQQQNFTLPVPPCEKCLNWDVLREPNNNLSLTKPPEHYPLDDANFFTSSSCYRIIKNEKGEVRLRTFRISYASLKAAIDVAHDGYCRHGWTHLNCSAFLSVEGINNKFIEEFNIYAQHCLSLKLAMQDPTNDAHRRIMEDAAKCPQKYKRIPYPIQWTRPSISLSHHPDVIMHLVFLGIVKSVVLKIHGWLATQSKKETFLQATQDYLDGFLSMTVEWISIMPYSRGKLGGWVSENYLAFGRIMPWFFQNIEEAAALTDPEPPEHLPQRKWTAAHNRRWLQVRNMETDGYAKELSLRVAEEMLKPNPKEALPTPKLPADDVKEVVVALTEVLRCVMSSTVNPTLVNRTRYAVRIFLSKYDSLCKSMDEDKPSVLSTYNFVCLLNLPDTMAKFGPLRHLWEGGPRGEGFARFAKPHMTMGVSKKNWHNYLLTTLLRAKTFNNLLPKQTKPFCGVKHTDALRYRSGNFHKYEAELTFLDFFGRASPGAKVPVSVLLLEHDNGDVQIAGVVGDYDSVLFVQVNTTDPTERFGCHYYKLRIDSEQSVAWTSVASSVARIGYGMLLPLRRPDQACRFAVISSNWQNLEPSIDLKQLID